MAHNQRSDPTFNVFVVLAVIFVVVLSFVTFPRPDTRVVTASDTAPATPKK